MRDFSQEIYNWLLGEKIRLEEFEKNDDINIRVGFGNQLVCLKNIIKKYKEICFERKEAEK